VKRYSNVTGLALRKGDTVRVVTGNGAGWGDPRKRAREKVREDLKNGFVTEEEAREVYGYEG
jgi:N-methylhydantoinase B